LKLTEVQSVDAESVLSVGCADWFRCRHRHTSTFNCDSAFTSIDVYRRGM